MLDLRRTHPVLFWIMAVPLGLIALFIAQAVIVAIAHSSAGILAVVILFAGYWIPTMLAYRRHHQVGLVAVLNGLLGWTFIGWVVALAIACGDRHPAVVEVHHVTKPPAAS